uniref:Uncharacterized protein n=1 Tax=Panagrolaimus davidi TaxID=227884 RepID=A0A914QVC6_9BILA
MSETTTFEPIKNVQKEDYIAVCTTVENSIKIHVIGYKSKSVIAEYLIAPETVTNFIEEIPKIFDGIKCKAILFDIYKFEPLSTEFPHIINLCYTIRFKLDDLRIKYYFYSDRTLFLSGLLISAKISNPSKDDVILFILANAEKLIVNEYKFGEFGYEKLRDISVTIENKDSFAEIRDKILAGTKPKKIIVFGADMDLPIMKKFKKNIFNQEKLIFREKKFIAVESAQHSLKISKWILNPSYVKYHIIQRCAKKFCLSSCLGSPFLTIEAGEKLPYDFEEYAFRSSNVIAVSL